MRIRSRDRKGAEVCEWNGYSVTGPKARGLQASPSW
jgi:hypothetical protein